MKIGEREGIVKVQVEVILKERKVKLSKKDLGEMKVTKMDLGMAFGNKEAEMSRNQAEDWNRGQVEEGQEWEMRGWQWQPGYL